MDSFQLLFSSFHFSLHLVRCGQLLHTAVCAVLFNSCSYFSFLLFISNFNKNHHKAWCRVVWNMMFLFRHSVSFRLINILHYWILHIYYIHLQFIPTQRLSHFYSAFQWIWCGNLTNYSHVLTLLEKLFLPKFIRFHIYPFHCVIPKAINNSD